jgi:pimeloyl-ACP methyl ester carboxylesterase
MMRRWAMVMGTALLVACSRQPAQQQSTLSAAVADDPVDQKFPAGMETFTIPVADGSMNAVMYTAAGAGPHPTLLLLHGFPGNERNLDLAQAARRAGWNVLTQNYRGSWGSKGAFTFEGAAEDARASLSFLKAPGNVAKYRIDPARIALLGHSMGGYTAAAAASADPAVIGLFLIDAWDIAADARTLTTPQAVAQASAGFAADVPALQGTSPAALAAELKTHGTTLDLAKRLAEYGDRPLDIVGAERGGGKGNAALLAGARAAGNTAATGETWSTDHSFSDKRIALAERLVAWLALLQPVRGQ